MRLQHEKGGNATVVIAQLSLKTILHSKGHFKCKFSTEDMSMGLISLRL